MTENILYNEEKDAACYANEPAWPAVIGNAYFMVVWPDDAHEPLLCTPICPQLVNKVVMKVAVKK